MTISKGSYHCWNRLRNDPPGLRNRYWKFIGLIILLLTGAHNAQASAGYAAYPGDNGFGASSGEIALRYSPGNTSINNISNISMYPACSRSVISKFRTGPDGNGNMTEGGIRDTVPDPSSVWRKSLMVPGWGQVVNEQTWKVPVIYGLLGGLTYYSILMHQNYRDYRAAFYNSQPDTDDERFGPTPGHIDPNTNPESLRYTRNMYRNRRDLTFIGILLAYGLNIVDAYVFAQMRDFDVSDDLSANISLDSPLYSGHNGAVDQVSSGMIPGSPDKTGFRFTISLQIP